MTTAEARQLAQTDPVPNLTGQYGAESTLAAPTRRTCRLASVPGMCSTTPTCLWPFCEWKDHLEQEDDAA